MKIREPASSIHYKTAIFMSRGIHLLYLCASGFSSVKWVQELNWLPSSLSRILRTVTFEVFGRQNATLCIFYSNLPCKYVLYIVHSGMVWHCEFFYENKSCLHALMLNYNFIINVLPFLNLILSCLSNAVETIPLPSPYTILFLESLWKFLGLCREVVQAG